MGNEIDRVATTESRSQWKLHCKMEMENEIDRVATTGNCTAKWKWEMRSIESRSLRVAVIGNCTANWMNSFVNVSQADGQRATRAVLEIFGIITALQKRLLYA